MKKRRLNKEEAALWDQVAKTMQPLRPPKAAKISETKKTNIGFFKTNCQVRPI